MTTFFIIFGLLVVFFAMGAEPETAQQKKKNNPRWVDLPTMDSVVDKIKTEKQWLALERKVEKLCNTHFRSEIAEHKQMVRIDFYDSALSRAAENLEEQGIIINP